MLVYELLESKIVRNIHAGEAYRVMYEKFSKRDVHYIGYTLKEGKAEIEECLKVIKGYDSSDSLQVICQLKLGKTDNIKDDATYSIDYDLNFIK